MEVLKMKKSNITEKMVVAVDPYNEAGASSEIFSTTMGVVIKSDKNTCDVFSMQTMEVLTIPKKYLYDISDVKNLSGEITVKRDCNPIFSTEDLAVLRLLKKTGNLIGKEQNILDNIIDKVEAHLLSKEMAVGIVESKECSIDYPTVNTIINYNIKEEPEENLQDSINMMTQLEKVSEFIDSTIYMAQFNTIRVNISKLIDDMFKQHGKTVDTAVSILDMILDAIIQIGPSTFDSPIFIDNLMQIYSAFEDVECRKKIADYIFSNIAIPPYIKKRIAHSFVVFEGRESGFINPESDDDFDKFIPPFPFGNDYE